jgi:uncharacterized membrane protein
VNNGSNVNKKRVAALKWIFFVLLAVVFAADFFVERPHTEFAWDHIPGFSAVYGFVSVIVIIIVAKIIGAIIVTKKEDYYD